MKQNAAFSSQSVTARPPFSSMAENPKIVAILLMCIFAPAFAQDQSLLGRYMGNFQAVNVYGVTFGVGLELVIESVEGGLVRGTAISYGKPSLCGGTYTMIGTQAGDTLNLIASRPGGPRKDCGLRLKLRVEGEKLVGETGIGYPIQLTKR